MMRTLSMLAAAFALSGCGASTLSPAYVRDPGLTSLYVYGAAGRDLRLDLQGGAFGQPAAALAPAVERALAGFTPPGYPATRFTASPGPSAQPDYRVLMVMGAPFGRFDDEPCARPATVAPEGGEATSLMAAFCQGATTWSSVTARSEVRSPDDPAFTAMMREIIVALFPPDRLQKDNCDFVDC